MRTLPDTSVFSRDDAKALGWTDSAISRALRTGRLVAVRRGQLTAATECSGDRYRDHERSLVVAAQAVVRARGARGGSVISHHVAALIHGLPLLRQPPATPTITVPPRCPEDAVGARVLRATLAADDIVNVDGWRVTSVARTLVDLGRWEPTPAAVVTIDAALHLYRTTPEAIDAVLVRCWNWPRISRAQRAVTLADPRSESPLESVSRLALIRLRVPAPMLQQEIRTSSGRRVRPDFYWDEFGVAGEADGRGKYESSPASLLEEKQRQEEMEDAGLVVVRWGWDEVRHSSELLRRLAKAIDRAQARSRSGLPREWSIW